MKTKLILGAAVLALAACGSSGNKGGGSSATGSGSSGGGAAGLTLQPGEWEMKTQVVNVSAPGLPDAVANSMKSQAGGTSRSCMTAEEAKGPKADMYSGAQGSNCKTEGFSWAGGRIHGKTTCPGPGGTGSAVMTMDGQYSAQSMDVTIKSDTDIAGNKVSMEMKMNGRRVGDCPSGGTAG
ncbi:MAG: DUF3617 domain-containing protein [Allosphingosinicella sp.]